jgi:hypothetical protein
MQTPKQSNSFLKCKATNLIMGVIHVPQHTILNLCNQSLLPEYQINNPKNNHSRKSHFRVMSNCSDQLKTCKNLKYKGWNIVWKAIPSSFSGPYVPSHSVAWAVSQIAPGHALKRTQVFFSFAWSNHNEPVQHVNHSSFNKTKTWASQQFFVHVKTILLQNSEFWKSFVIEWFSHAQKRSSNICKGGVKQNNKK